MYSIYFIGRICGTHCLRRGSDICECGGVEFNPSEYVYCCSQSTCTVENDRIVCLEGKKLNFKEKCGNQCPIGELSKIIVSKQCSTEESCPPGKDFSLICNGNKITFQNGKLNCPKKASSKFDLSQYYQ